MRVALALALSTLAARAAADPPGSATLAAVTAAMPARVRPAHDLTTWIDRDGERIVAAMLTCNNAEPCVGWARLDAQGAVVASGTFSLEFPRTLTVRDTRGDGRPELIVDGAYFTGESPGEAPRTEVWSFPRGATAPVQVPARRRPR
ncbi:MAG: hypothetical protein U0325_02395 [Polyangiales bacterium]